MSVAAVPIAMSPPRQEISQFSIVGTLPFGRLLVRLLQLEAPHGLVVVALRVHLQRARAWPMPPRSLCVDGSGGSMAVRGRAHARACAASAAAAGRAAPQPQRAQRTAAAPLEVVRRYVSVRRAHKDGPRTRCDRTRRRGG